MSQEQLLMLPVWYAAFLLSTTFHEAAHALAAKLGGDETAYRGGQMTLNPLPHMRREPFGTVLVPLLSYMYMAAGSSDARWMIGWASAPYDPLWEEHHPRRAAWMAAAGPLANLALAAVAFAVLKAGLQAGLWAPAHWIEFIELDRLVEPGAASTGNMDGLGRLCSVLLSLNVALFLFNLLPVPPLDGASVLAGLSRHARRLRNALQSSPMGAIVGLVAAWYLFGRVFSPIYVPVLRKLYGG